MSLDKTKLCHELTVKEKILEAKDTYSLAFEIPESLKEKFKYRAGQFVTLFLDINGEEVRRSYSLCTAPEYDKDFKVTVRKVHGGKGSPYLVDKVQPGDKLWVTPPAGLFCLPKNLDAQKLIFYAAGSGITPIISLIKSALKTTNLDCVLYYQNRSEDYVIFKKDLERLSEIFGSRFQVEHCLSAPDENWKGLCGRINKDSLRDFLARNLAGIRSLHFMCGPVGFMATIEDGLKALGVPAERIHKESFTVPVSESKPAAAVEPVAAKPGAPAIPKNAIVIGTTDQPEVCEQIEVNLEGEIHTVAYKEGASVLETLLDADLNPPYSCMDGACMACIAKIEDGLVYQNDMGILTDDNVEAHETLTCQARPLSRKLRIKYEIF